MLSYKWPPLSICRTAAECMLGEMVQMTDLPFDVLNVIMIILAMSSDGARDLARASAICKRFMTIAKQPNVLRVVNFQTYASDYTRHYHINDLLCLCARAGNLIAESILGKALLNYDFWFWNMIMMNTQPVVFKDGSSSGPLRHERLVRSFIRHGSPVDIANMRIPLFNYVTAYAGYDMARESGFLHGITCMCSYEILKLRLNSATQTPEEVGNNFSLIALGHVLARLVMPPPRLSHRDIVLSVFNKLFPLTPV